MGDLAFVFNPITYIFRTWEHAALNWDHALWFESSSNVPHSGTCSEQVMEYNFGSQFPIPDISKEQ